MANDVNVTFDSSMNAKSAIQEGSPIQYIGESANEFGKYSLKLPKSQTQTKTFELQLLGINDFHGQLILIILP